MPTPFTHFFESIRVHPWLKSLFTIWDPANPKPKSTAGYRKSTVDLGCELLIWGKTGLQTSVSLACRHPFHPTTAREMKRANQIQTDTGQKINHAHALASAELNLLAGQKSFMVSV